VISLHGPLSPSFLLRPVLFAGLTYATLLEHLTHVSFNVSAGIFFIVSCWQFSIWRENLRYNLRALRIDLCLPPVGTYVGKCQGCTCIDKSYRASFAVTAIKQQTLILVAPPFPSPILPTYHCMRQEAVWLFTFFSYVYTRARVTTYQQCSTCRCVRGALSRG
jgi:hypothetical protein